MEHAEADRTRLLDAAAEVLLAAVASDRTGPLAYFREILAAGRYLYDAQRRYAALEYFLAAGEAAVREAPADPFMNGLLASVRAERQAARTMVLREASRLQDWY